MVNHKKIFTGKMNMDVDPRFLPEGDYSYAENILTSNAKEGSDGVVTNVPGNLESIGDNFSLPSGINKTIGTAKDFKNNRVVYFLYNSSGSHGIYSYDTKSQTITKKFEWIGLNFTSETVITNAEMVDSLLYWSDSDGRLRKINLDDPPVIAATTTNQQLVHSNVQFSHSGSWERINVQNEDVASKYNPGDTIVVTGTSSNNSTFTVDHAFYYASPLDYTQISVVETVTNESASNVQIENQSVQTGTDTFLDELYISLHRPQPFFKPLAEPLAHATITDPILQDSNYQFAYRYVFYDNERSPLSPYSNIISPVYEEAINFFYKRIKISVNTGLPSGIVEKIEYFVRNGNKSTWYQFGIDDAPTLLAGVLQSTIYYYGTEIATALSDSEASKLMEAIPDKGTALQVMRNRVITNVYEDGFDFSNYNVSLTAGTTAVTANSETSTHRSKYAKEGGRFNIGIRYSNRVGKLSSVKNSQRVDVAWRTVGSRSINYFGEGTSLDSDTGYYVSETRDHFSWSLTGAPPEWATHYQIVISKNQIQSQYACFPAFAMFCVGTDAAAAGETVIGSFTYKNVKPDSTGAGNYTGYQSTHLQMPLNIPFVPEKGMYVKIRSTLNNVLNNGVFEIHDVVDDKLILDKYLINGGDWANQSEHLLIEVYSKNKESDNEYYEYSDVYAVNNPGTSSRAFSTSSGTMEGTEFFHAYYSGSNENTRKESTFFFEKSPSASLTGDYTTIIPAIIEAPTNIFKNTGVFQSVPSLKEYIKIEDVNVFQAIRDYDEFKADYIQRTAYTLDYSKIDSNIGRPNIANNNERTIRKGNVERFSDTYIQGSNINGLSSFNDLNEYTIPQERGDIIKLVKADNVLLAIHERNITSQYVGENLLKDVEGNEQIIKTEGFIAHDRVLNGEFGTKFPHSVVSNKGRVYGYDIYRGEVWRYSNNGVDGLGELYGMSSYIKSISEQMLEDISNGESVNVYGGYDQTYDLYYITFSSPSVNKTLVYKERAIRDENGFIGFITYYPELYGFVGTNMVSFMNGKLRLHYGNDLYNLFEDEIWESKIKYPCNTEPSKVKLWKNFSIETTSIPGRIVLSNSDGQETDVFGSEMKLIEGVYYGTFKRDKNSSNVPVGKTALLSGDLVKSQIADIEIRYESGLNSKIELQFVNIGYKHQIGHTA